MNDILYLLLYLHIIHLIFKYLLFVFVFPSVFPIFLSV